MRSRSLSRKRPRRRPSPTQAAADEAMAAASEGVADVAPSAQPTPSDNGKTFLSPVVARIASEHGVDPNEVQGTGRGGRVTKKDILEHIGSGAQAPAAEPEAPEAPAAPSAPP